MPLSSRYWQDLPWPEFRTLPPDTVAVLPVAAMEQHGPHLPIAVDTTINQGIVARALTKLPPDAPVLVLPTQAVGLSVEHIRFPGTLTGSVESLFALWTEIGESVARAGVRRLIILNSHGGQPQVVEMVCRRLRGRARMFAVSCMWSRLGAPDGLVDPGGIHGGLIETSLMLRLAPERVDMSRARNFRNAWLDRAGDFPTMRPEGPVGFGWETQDLHPDGALGDASRASAAIGERVLDLAATRVAGLIEEVGRFDIESWLRDTPTT